jgi:[protein-PII] uridylyltransferase
MLETNRPKTASPRGAIAQAQGSDALAGILGEERERLKEANRLQPQGIRGCRALTEVTDLTIQRMLALALPADGPEREATRPRIAIVATGGYGRRELCPYSDIDVTFIVAEEEDPALDATVRQMFHLLMETFSQGLGLKVGYAYRTLSDVAQLDHQTQTALLDTRVVAGSHGLTDQFLLRVFRSIWPAAFVRQKVAERRASIEKHGGTPYRIEPEVREGPGGLRDLHLAQWLATVSFPTTRGEVWPQLQRLGAVSRRDVQQVGAAREFLLKARTWMHWHAGRAADGLVRERQELLAEALVYRDDDRASRVERFMEQYYEHTENVSQVVGFVIDRCLAERLSITDELACSGGDLLPAYPWIHVSSPRFLVEICQHFQRHALVPGYELRRMIAQHLGGCVDLGADTEAADDFVGLLRAPSSPPAARGEGGAAGPPGVYDTLALMARLGILQCLIPEIGEAYRRVPFDQVHQHTIGFHSLEVIRSLEALRTSADEKLAEFRRIWTEVEAPELLFLAGLLHDVGKVAPGGGHAAAGALMASSICERLRLDPPSTARVEMLVRHHLLMSETAQLRDLTMEKTIHDFTQVINSRDLLNMLLLLTYADMEATGVLSPVKVRFLEDLYYRAEATLSSAGPEPDLSPERTRRFKSRISRRLAGANLTQEQIEDHTEGMPVAYLLNTRPEQIALHIRMVETLRSDGPAVEFDAEPDSEITTIHICTLEHPEPGLLSRIAGVLYAHEISVHGAQVFTRHSSPAIALDSLWADFHGRPIPPLKRLELEQDLVATLKGGEVQDVIVRYRKQLPPAIPPSRVRLDNEVAESHTVMEIEAEDQPALLYRITRAIAALGWNIHSARISTRGDQARDAFYVTAREGGKLEEDEARLVDLFLAEFAG